MAKFRTRPELVEARQHDGTNIEEVALWCGGSVDNIVFGNDPARRYINILTPHGCELAGPGTWIVEVLPGEFHACEPDIFEATYEPVED